MITFNSIDVETANFDRSSICQIGITCVREGVIVDQWETLVDPEEWFDEFNVSIHGIDRKMVRGAPKFPEIRDKLCSMLQGSILVSHTSFDRNAIREAMEKYDLERFQVSWADSAKIVRRTWPEKYSKRGYGLKNVAKDLGIEFKHHNALEDSRAAAEIVIFAYSSSDSELDFFDWTESFRNKPVRVIDFDQKESGIEGITESELNNETILFTGNFCMPKKELAIIASGLGCNVVNTVKKEVSILVVGKQFESVLKGYKKSSKHRKIEELIENGSEISIISETDFLGLVNMGEVEETSM